MTLTIAIIPAPEIWHLWSAEAFLFCNLSIKKHVFETKWQKNLAIRPLLSSSLRSRLYWLPSIDISSSFSQVLPRFPAGRRWCLFYLFTFSLYSFYSFYPYLFLYRSFFLSCRSQNIRVLHLIIFHFTFKIFRWFCQQPQCLFLFFSPHLFSFEQSLRWNSRSALS